MANNTWLVEELSLDLGKFLVGRLLPFREKRMVGPFCFIDHMGPSEIGPGRWLDVDQHPHIGLCTLTYLLQGQVEHRDSTGAIQLIEPESVNLMISGRGVSHTERSPAEARQAGLPQTLHGYQVWIALPRAFEQMEPGFQHVARQHLPQWVEDDLNFRLVVGSAFGFESPVRHFSPLFMLDVKATFRSMLSFHGRVQGEIALVVVSGKIWADEQEIGPGQMLISKIQDICQVYMDDDSRILAFGGEPLPEDRFMFWNFISSSKEVLEQAKQDWKEHKFPKVPGDDTYIAMP